MRRLGDLGFAQFHGVWVFRRRACAGSMRDGPTDPPVAQLCCSATLRLRRTCLLASKTANCPLFFFSDVSTQNWLVCSLPGKTSQRGFGPPNLGNSAGEGREFYLRRCRMFNQKAGSRSKSERNMSPLLRVKQHIPSCPLTWNPTEGPF